MTNADELQANSRSIPAPGYVIPGIRCALEMVIVATIIGLLGLPTSKPLHLGIVLVAMVIGMVVVLFWCLNRHIAEWIRRAQGKPTIR